MKKTQFTEVIEFLMNVIEDSDIDGDDLRVAVAMYKKRGSVLYDFNQHYSKSAVLSGLRNMAFKKARFASVAEGLDTVREKLLVNSAGYRSDVPNLVVIVTDAISNVDVDRTIEAAEKLKAVNTAIFGVGLNLSYPNEIHGLVSSESYTLFVNDTKWLKGKELYLQDQFVGCKY